MFYYYVESVTSCGRISGQIDKYGDSWVKRFQHRYRSICRSHVNCQTPRDTPDIFGAVHHWIDVCYEI